LFNVMSSPRIAVNVAMMEIGTGKSCISVLRRLRMNNSTTIAANQTADDQMLVDGMHGASMNRA